MRPCPGRETGCLCCRVVHGPQIAPADRPKVKSECLRLMATLRLNPAKAHIIAKFVDRYLRLNAVETLIFDREMAVFAPQEVRQVAEYITSWEEKGISIGFERGIAQGFERGIAQARQQAVVQERERLLRQLRRRVGELTADVQTQETDCLLNFRINSAKTCWISPCRTT